jgi:hypothetical protein
MTQIISVEDFEDQTDKELVCFTGHLLQKFYPGYLWGVRLLAKSMVGFSLGELLQFGDCHVMVVHPKDVPTMHDFEGIVKRLGGELLERAKLSRDKSRNVAVETRPDGFNSKFDETIREHKVVLTDKFTKDR